MLNVPGLRVYLGAWLGSVVSASVKVYAKGARDGLADLPGVVLGEVEVPEFATPTGCFDRYALTVALVWPRPAIDDEALQAAFEAEWLALVEALRNLQDEDPALGGLVASWRLLSSEFGSLLVRGASYPAHVISFEVTA